MALFIDGFSSEVVPRQGPGEVTGVCVERYRFIYLTGSGQFSRLLLPGSVEEILREAEAKVPMGYNQLWLFEKKSCVAPSAARAGSGPRFNEARRQSPADLPRHLWPGRLHAVLQDPQQATKGPIVLTYHAKPGEAARYAQVLANEWRVRMLVALLLADVTWH